MLKVIVETFMTLQQQPQRYNLIFNFHAIKYCIAGLGFKEKFTR